ncbi:MAG: DMT family transporter [Chloroflexota bacterium]|nr:DMT family transporter [Chloroflexota bacterium]
MARLLDLSVRAARLDALPTPGVAMVALALLNLAWGGSLPATKLALDSFGPLTLACARLLVAAGLFMAVLGGSGIRRVPRAEAWRMAGLGVIGCAGVQVFQAVGAAHTSGAAATVLASTAPLWIAVLAPVLLFEPLRARTVAGLLLALVGLAAMTGLGGDDWLAGSLLGNLVVMLSSAAAALYTVLGKDLAQRHSPLVLCGLSCAGGAVASLPWAAVEMVAGPPAPTPLGWTMLAYLSVLVTFIGFLVWFWGLRALPAARAGALMFLQPLSGLALAVLVLGDRPTAGFLLGGALVLAGVYVAAAPR